MPSPEVAQRLDEARSWRSRQAVALSSKPDPRGFLAELRQAPQYQTARELTKLRRWEHLAQKIPKFSEETWERTGRVLSGINNGVKAALFVDIAQNAGPGGYMPIKNIVDHFKELFAGTQLLKALGKGTKNKVIAYCQSNFVNVGLLTAEYSPVGKLIGFGVTKEGVDSGLPHALRLVDWENTMRESAYAILGKVGSPGETKAPSNSAIILEYLFRHPYDSRETDLMADSVGVARALKRFYTLGLIDLKSTRYRYAWDTRIDLKQAPSITRFSQLQPEIITVIEQRGSTNPKPMFSINDIAEELLIGIRRGSSTKSLKDTISIILSGLAKNRLLQRVNDFRGREKQSDITFLQKGRSFFFRIILPTLLESPVQPLSVSLSELAQTSAELYYPHSNSNRRKEQQKNIERLAQAIGEKPQTAIELTAIVNLSPGSINRILSPSKGSSEVIIEVDDKSVTVIRTKVKGAWCYIKKPEGE